GGGGDGPAAGGARGGEGGDPEGPGGPAGGARTPRRRARRGPAATDDEHSDRRRRAVDRRGEYHGARRAQRGPETEVREGAAAWSRVAEPDDPTHAIVDDVDGPGDRCALEHRVEGDGTRVVQRDPLRELRKDPAVRRVLAGADEHADPSTLPGEQTAGNGAALHHPAEDDEPLAVQRGRAEAGERTA